MVIEKFYPIVGGSQIQAERLASMLVQKGIAVEILTTRPRGTKPYEQINGVKVRRIWAPGFRLLKRLTKIALFYLAILKRSNNFDILHIHLGFEPAYAGVKASNYLRKPCIVKIGNSGQNFDMDKLVKKFPFRLGLLMARYIAKNTTRFIVMNDQIQLDLCRWGVTESQTASIPNGVPLYPPISTEKRLEYRKILGLPLDRRIIVCVSRLSHRKNQATLLEAFTELCNDGQETFLIFLGDGTLRRKLKQQALKSGFKDRIIFKGYVSNVLEYLYASDVFVLPSIVEGLSNALLEAMSVGMPCVVSNEPGNRILVKDGVNGFMYEPRDAAALGKVLKRLLNEKELAYQMGKNARELIHERYSIQSVAQQYIALYNSMVQGNY
ncbi:MAG: glycosyltransferase family 4 protein [Candidatus Brocadiales bacterium]